MIYYNFDISIFWRSSCNFSWPKARAICTLNHKMSASCLSYAVKKNFCGQSRPLTPHPFLDNHPARPTMAVWWMTDHQMYTSNSKHIISGIELFGLSRVKRIAAHWLTVDFAYTPFKNINKYLIKKYLITFPSSTLHVTQWKKAKSTSLWSQYYINITFNVFTIKRKSLKVLLTANVLTVSNITLTALI